MADSHAVDQAQAAGFTVASTTGVVSGPISAGGLHRLQRVVETAGGRVEFADQAAKSTLALLTGAGKAVDIEAVDAGEAGDTITLALALPADDNQAHAISIDASTADIVVTLGVDTDGSTVVTTAADLVDELNADEDASAQIVASLGAGPETLAQLTFVDFGTSAGDNLILTGKAGADLFSCTVRRPKTKGPEADDTAVSVNLLSRNHIEVVVPATKTVANVKTAIEAHTAANALVTVTTAGTTTHAVVCDDKLYEQSSFANRGAALCTAVTETALAGGVDSNEVLRIVPAVA